MMRARSSEKAGAYHLDGELGCNPIWCQGRKLIH
jgi:hypothetical protein